MNIYNLYFILLFLSIIVSVSRWGQLSIADKWLSILLIATLGQEGIAYYLAKTYHNNFITYHFYTPIELVLICLYFDRSIRMFSPYRLVGVIGAIGVALSLIDTLFLQNLYELNSYFLLFEGCVVILLCLSSFYILLTRGLVPLGKSAQFWITFCFLFYWSLTFANFGLYGGLINAHSTFGKIFANLLYGANILFYLGITTIFLRYKKLVPSGDT